VLVTFLTRVVCAPNVGSGMKKDKLELDIVLLCRGLMKERPEMLSTPTRTKETWILHLSDLISLICILSVAPLASSAALSAEESGIAGTLTNTIAAVK